MDRTRVAENGDIATASLNLVLAPAHRRRLEQLLRQTTLSQAIAERVRVVLALSEGDRYSTIAPPFACTDRFIVIWKRRFVHLRLPALADALRAAKVGVTHTTVTVTYIRSGTA